MSEGKNILECDGLIVRGKDGRKRAEIEVRDSGRGETVSLCLYGADDVSPAESAFNLDVDERGRTFVWIGYAGVDDNGVEHVKSTLRIRSGDKHHEPYIRYFGNVGLLDHAPTHVIRGARVGRWSDFVAAVLEVARESADYGLDEDPDELMEDLARILKHEQKTGKAVSR